MKVACKFDELVSVKKLKKLFNERNRNKHPDYQIERLAYIFDKNWIRHPVVISKLSGKIIKGHGRVLAAEKAGLKEYPVEYQEYESEEQEIQDLNADNAIALWAEIDMSGVNIDIQDFGPDIDLDAMGFKNFFATPEEKYVDNPTDEWKDMPEFNQPDKTSYRQIIVHFDNEEDVAKFFKLVDQSFTEKTKYIWFPQQEKRDLKSKQYE